MNKNTKAKIDALYKCANLQIHTFYLCYVSTISNLKTTYVFRDANTLAGRTNKLVMHLCNTDLFYSSVSVREAKFDAIAFSIYFKSYPDVGYTRNARCPFWLPVQLRGGKQ